MLRVLHVPPESFSCVGIKGKVIETQSSAEDLALQATEFILAPAGIDAARFESELQQGRREVVRARFYTGHLDGEAGAAAVEHTVLVVALH